jgi:hypothetical protein
MKIENRNFPMAGESFRFEITGATGKTRVEAHIDRKPIFVHDCPDPPCHETILVPPGTRGAELRLVAIDSTGNRAERVFAIATSDTNTGGMMNSGGLMSGAA